MVCYKISQNVSYFKGKRVLFYKVLLSIKTMNNNLSYYNYTTFVMFNTELEQDISSR